MNCWRWICAVAFAVGLFVLTGALLPALAQDKGIGNKAAAIGNKATAIGNTPVLDKAAQDKAAADKAKADKAAADKAVTDKAAADKAAADKAAADKAAKDKGTPPPPPAAAGDQFTPDLFTAFKDGSKTFYQKIKTVTNQKMTVEKQTVPQVQNQTFYIEWTPQKGNAGEYSVKQKIIGVKMEIVIGSNKINYDSTDDKAASPMADFFNALKQAELTFILDAKTLTVKEVKGRTEFIEKLASVSPQMKSLLNNILSDDAVKQMAQPCWGAIPPDAKKKGETWMGQTSKLNLGAIGSYKTDFKYTYEGGEKIAIMPTMTYIAPEGENKDLPFKIMKDGTNLTSKEAKGEVTFDRANGRIGSSKMTLKLGGTLVIDVGGTSTSVALEQEQTSDMTTVDASDADITKMLGSKK